MTLAWHFLKDDGTTAHGGLKPQVGKTLRAKGPLVLCGNGMHASAWALDALRYANGALIERVEMVGPLIEGADKLCARGRKTLWLYDATYELHEFSCREALRALRKAKVTDQQCYDAITAKRRWMVGKATGDELAAAAAAARAVAREAAWVAVGAAWAVARGAAWVAAREAWVAAWEAAGVAAWAAGRAAWMAQNTRLEKMLNAGAKKRGLIEGEAP